MSEETSKSGGGLAARLDKMDGSNTTEGMDHQVGREEDAHNAAASKQP